MGNLLEALGPVLVVAAICGVNQWMEKSLIVSLHLPFKLKKKKEKIDLLKKWKSRISFFTTHIFHEPSEDP